LAIPLLAIGELIGHALSGHKGPSHAKSAPGDLNFGAQLQQQLGQIQTDGSDLISQIAGMLQAGTPLATIISNVSQSLSSAVATLTGNDNETARQTLQRALAGALAPPGNGPPGQSSTQLAASLEQKLMNVVSKISRELEKTAGQQNRFSGQVLDANSARELPAQQSKQATGAIKPPAGSLSFADSILQQILQALGQGGASQNATPQPASPTNVHLPIEQLASPSRTLPISVHSDDLLARMLARAAQNAAPAASAPAVTASPSATPAGSPSQILARLLNVIAQAASENGGQSSGGRQGSQSFAQHAQTPSTPTNVPGFAATTGTAPASAAQTTQAAVTPYVMDPNAIIEQVVKGIVLRNAGATSEVRLQLQPAHLGDVSLKLTVTGNTISANIVAQNADVRDALLSNQQHLARSLADAGLSLGKFSVNVSGGNSGSREQQLHHRRGGLRTGALQLDSIAEDETWADRIGPPVLAGTRSLVLNYLA
jgi:flagellar hook-length control protein FliK